MVPNYYLMILQVVGSPDFWKLQQNGRKLHKGLKSDVKTAPQTNPVCPYGGMVTHKTWVMTVQWPRNLAAFFGKATNAAIYLHLHLAIYIWMGCSFESFTQCDRGREYILLFFILTRTCQGDKWGWFPSRKKNIFSLKLTSRTWKLMVGSWKTSSFPFWGPKRPYFSWVFYPYWDVLLVLSKWIITPI